MNIAENIGLAICCIVLIAMIILLTKDEIDRRKRLKGMKKFGFLNRKKDKEFINHIENNVYGYELEERKYESFFNDNIPNYIIKNNFGLKMEIIGESILDIYIDNIKVFNYKSYGRELYGWKHTIPEEMQDYVFQQLEYLKLEKKKYEERCENESNKTFNEEREYLINKFKGE